MLKHPVPLARYSSGVSLVELMVALAVGLVISLAAGTLFLTSVRGGADSLRSAKLNVELRSAMDLIEGEIRRAGYGGQPIDNDPFRNPYTQDTTDLTIPVSSCILFAYNANDSLVELPTMPPADHFSGFKLANQRIWMRYTSAGQTNEDGCDTGTEEWEALTDENVVITGLSFAISYTCTNAGLPPLSPGETGYEAWQAVGERCESGESLYDAAATGHDLIESRLVTVTLAGEHADDSDTKGSLTRAIRVRNDRVVTK